MKRRLGTPEETILTVKGNLAITYAKLGRLQEANRELQDVYSGYLKLKGEENIDALRAACNYAYSLLQLRRFEEAKPLLRKTMPVARRVFGAEHRLTLKMRQNYAEAFFKDDGATIDELRETVTSLEETTRIARRVLGGTNPVAKEIGENLLLARAALRARETPPPGSS